LADEPGLINKDSMANWIIKVELSNPEELESLLDEAAYKEICH
jgi:glycine cleavage system H protein